MCWWYCHSLLFPTILFIPKLDQLGATLMSKDAHLRQMQRELALTKTSSEENHREASNVLERMKEMEKHMKEKEWDYADSLAFKNARCIERGHKCIFHATCTQDIAKRVSWVVSRIVPHRYTCTCMHVLVWIQVHMHCVLCVHMHLFI